MRVQRLDALDFRNHERAGLELGERLTVLHGPNGAGKTNLLEALYFGCVGRSCRTSNERELVRAGRPLARVRVEGEDLAGRHELEVGFAPGQPKRTTADGAPVERLTGISFRPLVSVFLPERLALVKGPPGPRRAHLDHLVAALWPARAETRIAYSRALGQRNALIARVRRGIGSPALLDPWDSELARHGSLLAEHRAAAIGLLGERFRALGGELGLPGEAELRYRPRSSTETPAGLGEELLARRSTDLERGFTTHGPHRDDVELRHAGRPLRGFGSQGQQRLALLALLFAERDVLAERGRSPLMLLDDVMSELDRERRSRLSELILAGGQAVVTTTDAAHVPGLDASGVAIVRIDAGAILPEPALAA